MHKFFLFLLFVTNDAEDTRLFSRCRIHDESSLVVTCNEPPFVSFSSTRSRMECSRKCSMINNNISIPTTPLFDSLLLPKHYFHFGINLISYDSFQFKSNFLPPSIPLPSESPICFGFNFDFKTGYCEIFDKICIGDNLEVLTNGKQFFQIVQYNKEMCYLGDYKDCNEIQGSQPANSGVYWITYDSQTYPIFCEISTTGVKYTVIQRRLDGSTNFTRNWEDYEKGFGNVKREFWIGNYLLHKLTTKYSFKLKVLMEAFDGTQVFAEYKTFNVGPPDIKYQLKSAGYSGTAGDSLAFQNGMKFSTIDADNDISASEDCAQTYKAGWWFKNCHRSNPNGVYGPQAIKGGRGICWATFRGLNEGLKMTQMMIYK